MKRFLLLLLLVAGCWLPARPVQAANLHYSVAAQLPANQIDTSVSYFALKMTPGAKQTLTITITNNDAQAHHYRVSVNRGVTNTNGEVDYTKHGVAPAASLVADIEKMTPKPFTVAVAANNKRAVPIVLTMPKQRFAGVAMGAIRVAELNSAHAASDKKGLTLTNEFAYAIGLTLQESDSYGAIEPRLVLRRVHAKQVNYRNTITAVFENTAPTVMHGLRLQVQVRKRGQQKAYIRYTKTNMAMAPNSLFKFPITTADTALQPGEYTLKVAASAVGKKQWRFSKQFTITGKQARRLNRSAVEQKRDPMRWLAIGGVLLVAGLGIVVIVLLMMLRRQKARR